MNIEVLAADKKANRVIFSLKGADVSFANAMRRAAIEEVPTMAIEKVEFRKNSSALYDEVIAHRLGLVPLTTDLKSYNLPAQCKCEGEGCAKCQLKLTLKVAGPGNVYASDLVSSDPKVKPVYPETLLTKLLKGQKLELEATATLGRGREHAKWSPGLVFYRYRQKVKVGSVKEPEKVAAMAPPGVFGVKNGKLVVNEDALLKVDLAGIMDNVEDVSVEEDMEELIFTVESWGQLSPREIMLQAATEFETQLKELEGILKEQ
jgi:DNA-directed RNA polymerase subunit D